MQLGLHLPNTVDRASVTNPSKRGVISPPTIGRGLDANIAADVDPDLTEELRATRQQIVERLRLCSE
jgi:hypothetical protein